MKIFNKLNSMFSVKGKIQIGVGDRVMENASHKLGRVTGIAKFNGSAKVPTLTVEFDDNSLGVQLPATNFIQMGRAV